MGKQLNVALIFKRCFIRSTLLLGLIAATSGASLAQQYPNKPIRAVTTALGGGNDVITRMIAPELSRELGQQMIVDNRPSGFIPGQIVANASPDGYTLLVASSTLWIGALTQKAPYDPVRDFAAISTLARLPFMLAVTTALPVTSVKDLIAVAKAKPRQLNNSIGSPGGAAHLAFELFKSMAGVDIVGVPYSSASIEMQDLLAGRLDMTFSNVAALREQIKTGKLKALAVTTAEPSALAPGVPTIAASGLPGYEWGQLIVMVAPDKTPTPVAARLNKAVVRLLNTPEVKERFLKAGVEAAGSSTEELGAAIKSETSRIAKLIKTVGIKTE